VAWREAAAANPPRRFAGQRYWARPVPAFGDPAARILMVGLAPAAHGGNRTGRIFTGDESGNFLFAALHAVGLANQPTSVSRDDGLALSGMLLSAAVRCAPPDNRPTPSECRQMLAFGATACLAKSTEARDVLHAIHLASRGLHVLPPAGVDPADLVGPDLLTPREAEVMELLQHGRSNAEIAETLHVSIETVRTHARRIYRKLGVRTRRDLRARR